MHCNITPDGTFGWVYSTTFDPELRNNVQNFFLLGGFIQQLFMLNSEMKDLH